MGIEFNSKFVGATLDPRWRIHAVNGAAVAQPSTNGGPLLSVDTARNHDFWIPDGTGANNENCDCAKLYQRCTAGDLDLRTAITTFPATSSTTQRLQGIFVSGATNFYGSYIIANVYRGTNGTCTLTIQYSTNGTTVQNLTGQTLTTLTTPYGIRLTRTGNVWRAYVCPGWSGGDNWNANVTWTQYTAATSPTAAINPLYAGVFVGNYRSVTGKADNSNRFLFFGDAGAPDHSSMAMAAA